VSVMHKSRMFKGPLNGLTGWFPFREGTGTSTRDWAGGTSGTLTNGPTWVAGGLYFDAADDYVDIPSSGGLNPSSAMSATIWMNADDDTDDYSALLLKPRTGSVGGNEQYIIFRDAATNNIAAGIRASGSMGYVQGSAWSGLVGGWHLVGFTYDASNLRFYVDGALINTQAKTGSIDTDSIALGIGGHSNGSFTKYDGQAGEARIYNRAISTEEMAYLYGIKRTV
jgi:hypothetical protein